MSFINQEKDHPKAPAQSVIVDFLPKLKEINLANNWIRSGYISLTAHNGGGWTDDQRRGLNQRTDFIICSEFLEKVDISGNYLGQNTHIYKGNIDLFNDGGWSNALKYKYYKDENKYRNGITVTTNNMKPTWYSFQWYDLGWNTGLVTPNLNSSHDDSYNHRGYGATNSTYVDYAKRYNYRKN